MRSSLPNLAPHPPPPQHLWILAGLWKHSSVRASFRNLEKKGRNSFSGRLVAVPLERACGWGGSWVSWGGGVYFFLGFFFSTEMWPAQKHRPRGPSGSSGHIHGAHNSLLCIPKFNSTLRPSLQSSVPPGPWSSALTLMLDGSQWGGNSSVCWGLSWEAEGSQFKPSCRQNKRTFLAPEPPSEQCRGTVEQMTKHCSQCDELVTHPGVDLPYTAGTGSSTLHETPKGITQSMWMSPYEVWIWFEFLKFWNVSDMEQR